MVEHQAGLNISEIQPCMPSLAFLEIASNRESEIVGEGDPPHTLVQQSEGRRVEIREMLNMARIHRMNIRNQSWVQANSEPAFF
jgi:hypothetical protein